MKLSQAQQEFTYCIAQLIFFAYSKGYGLTFGEAHRTIERAIQAGFKNSNHTRRLAVDFNLFKDGEWLKNTEDHKELGEYWESLHPLARWGGNFNDGNHYSFEWEGVR